jgi:hypothetical protein
MKYLYLWQTPTRLPACACVLQCARQRIAELVASQNLRQYAAKTAYIHRHYLPLRAGPNHYGIPVQFARIMECNEPGVP